jgi:hypothetical protein
MMEGRTLPGAKFFDFFPAWSCYALVMLQYPTLKRTFVCENHVYFSFPTLFVLLVSHYSAWLKSLIPTFFSRHI